MKDKEPKATFLTRDPTLRAEFIELLKTGMSLSEIAKFMNVKDYVIRDSFRRVLWETVFQLANEDEIAKLWACVLTLNQRLNDLEKKLNYKTEKLV